MNRKKGTGPLFYLLTLILIFTSHPHSAYEAGTQALPTLNVLLYEGPEAKLGSESEFYIQNHHNEPGEYSFTIQNGQIRLGDQIFEKEARLNPISPLFHLTFNGKPYRGSFLMKVSGDHLRLINQVTLEEYLYGVIAKEMPGSDLEALKAQAVASRTLALHAITRGKSMSSTITHQMYGGVLGEREIANQAVDETRDAILTYQGEPVTTPLFFSTCGGQTEDNADVFGKPLPYLTSVSDADESGGDAFCKISPYFSWTVTWPADSLSKSLEAFNVKGQITDLIAQDVDANGHVKELVIQTTEGEWKFRGFEVRRVLARPDGQPLYSTWFTISKSEENGITLFTATGHGEGHGVGMCQWGAIGMARSGKNYIDILTHYYPGTEVKENE